MTIDHGRSASPSGHSQAEPEEVSALRASVPNAWPEVEWEEGYPTAEDDEFLAWASLPLDFGEAARFILRELPIAAENCCAWCSVHERLDRFDGAPVKRIRFSTGGWSGAESLIGFIESRFDTRHFMQSWQRGGHYVFEIPASAIEARRAATAETGAVHESAVGNAETPKTSQGTSHG